MPMKPIEPPVRVPRRFARPAVALAIVVGVLVAMAMVVRSGDGPSRDRVETAAAEDHISPAPTATQRPGRPAAPHSPEIEQPDAGAGPGSTTPNRPSPTNPFVASRSAPAATSPTGVTGVTGAVQPVSSSTTTVVTPNPETEGSTTTSTAVPNPEPPTEPIEPPIETTGNEGGTVEVPPGPTEQDRCVTLGGVAVGDNTDGDPVAIAARGRFRAARSQIPETEGFQCGTKPLARFLDDLLIQRIRVAGEGFGILVGGLDPSDPVLWMNEVEWTSYKRMEPWDATHNFTGVPVQRTTIGGIQMIRTSRGAVVMVRSDSWGQVVVSGAWDVWMASGGPNGPMGLPEGLAIEDSEGAHQDFTNGVLELPDVTSKLEAEAMPASRYLWAPLTAEQLATPPPAVNTIQNVHGVSYYVDRAGVRHWLETTSDWSCARNDLGAKEVKRHMVGQAEGPLPGWQVARAPLGPVFVCPAKPPA